MALQLNKARRSKAFLKLGVAAPSGGGKTLGSLLIAYGIVKGMYPKESDAFRWGKIAIIDTENGSGELYVGRDVAGIVIGEYNAITLNKPFLAEKYIQSIELCASAGMDVCIIDSTTHLWSGEGGLLEQQNVAAKRGGNSYTAWRDITPLHNDFVSSMLQTNIHIIATMRAKQEYVQEKDSNTNKTTVKKLGMEPEQRKGMEYEFTTFLDIDAEHNAFGSKDRTGLFDQKQFKITPKVGEIFYEWLNGGTDAPAETVAVSAPRPADKEAAKRLLKQENVELCVKLGGTKNESLIELLRKYDPEKGNPNSIEDEDVLLKLHQELKDMLDLDNSADAKQTK